MKIENPAAFRFIIDEDLYLLKTDKLVAAIPKPGPVIAVAEKKPVADFKYLGFNKSNFLILVHYADKEFIDEAHLTALQNILKRMELTIAEVAIVNMNHHTDAGFDELTAFFKPTRLLLMGQKSLPKNAPFFDLNNAGKVNDCRLLYSFSFDEMMSSNDNKKLFWDQMKTL